jgi:hypothetical protein
MANITRHIRQLHSARDNTAKAIFVVGEQGSGKSTLSTRYLYEVQKDYNTIVTLEFKSLHDLHRSLIKAAVYFEFDVPSHGHSLKVQVDILSASLCQAMKRRRNWLLLVNNYKSDSSMSEYWPQPGDTRWGVGTVLVATNDRAIIPANNYHSAVVDISKGLEKDEAINLLMRMSNDSDTEGACRAIAKKSWKPYDLEVFAITHLYFKQVYTDWSWDQTQSTSQSISMETALMATVNSNSTCGNLLLLFGLLHLSCVPDLLVKEYLTLKMNQSHIEWENGLDRCLLVQRQDLAMMTSLNLKFWTIHDITYRILLDLVKSKENQQILEQDYLIRSLLLAYNQIKKEGVLEPVIINLFKPSIEYLLLTSTLPNHQVSLLFLMADVAGMQGNDSQKYELLTKALQIANQRNCSVHVNEKIQIVLELSILSVQLHYCETDTTDHETQINPLSIYLQLYHYHDEFISNCSKYVSAFEHLFTVLAVFNVKTSQKQAKQGVCHLMTYLISERVLDAGITCLHQSSLKMMSGNF